MPFWARPGTAAGRRRGLASALGASSVAAEFLRPYFVVVVVVEVAAGVLHLLPSSSSSSLLCPEKKREF